MTAILTFLLAFFLVAQSVLASFFVPYGIRGDTIFCIAAAWAILSAFLLHGAPNRSLRNVALPKAAAWMGAYVVWMGVSICWTETTNVPFVVSWWATSVAACVAIAIAMVAGREVVMNSALHGTVSGAVFTGIYLLVNVTSATHHAGNFQRPGENGMTHPNGLGASLGLGVICALFMLTEGRSRHRRIIALTVAFLTGCLLASTSKTSVAAAVVACLVYLALERARLRKKYTVLIAVSAAIILAIPYALPHISAYLNDADSLDTLSGRLELWRLLIPIIKSAPLIGHGYMWIALHPPLVWAGEAHNDLLQQLVSGGMVALFLALVMYSALLLRLWRHSGPYRALGIALVVYCLLRGLTEAGDLTIVPLYLALLLIYATGRSATVGPANLR